MVFCYGSLNWLRQAMSLQLSLDQFYIYTLSPMIAIFPPAFLWKLDVCTLGKSRKYICARSCSVAPDSPTKKRVSPALGFLCVAYGSYGSYIQSLYSVSIYSISIYKLFWGDTEGLWLERESQTTRGSLPINPIGRQLQEQSFGVGARA